MWSLQHKANARPRRLIARLTPTGYGIMVLADDGQHDIVDAREDEYYGGHGREGDEGCPVPCTWIRRVKKRRRT